MPNKIIRIDTSNQSKYEHKFPAIDVNKCHFDKTPKTVTITPTVTKHGIWIQMNQFILEDKLDPNIAFGISDIQILGNKEANYVIQANARALYDWIGKHVQHITIPYRLVPFSYILIGTPSDNTVTVKYNIVSIPHKYWPIFSRMEFYDTINMMFTSGGTIVKMEGASSWLNYDSRHDSTVTLYYDIQRKVIDDTLLNLRICSNDLDELADKIPYVKKSEYVMLTSPPQKDFTIRAEDKDKIRDILSEYNCNFWFASYNCDIKLDKETVEKNKKEKEEEMKRLIELYNEMLEYLTRENGTTHGEKRKADNLLEKESAKQQKIEA